MVDDGLDESFDQETDGLLLLTNLFVFRCCDGRRNVEKANDKNCEQIFIFLSNWFWFNYSLRGETLIKLKKAIMVLNSGK